MGQNYFWYLCRGHLPGHIKYLVCPNPIINGETRAKNMCEKQKSEMWVE